MGEREESGGPGCGLIAMVLFFYALFERIVTILQRACGESQTTQQKAVHARLWTKIYCGSVDMVSDPYGGHFMSTVVLGMQIRRQGTPVQKRVHCEHVATRTVFRDNSK